MTETIVPALFLALGAFLALRGVAFYERHRRAPESKRLPRRR